MVVQSVLKEPGQDSTRGWGYVIHDRALADGPTFAFM
jgi:hypothetical protein